MHDKNGMNIQLAFIGVKYFLKKYCNHKTFAPFKLKLIHSGEAFVIRHSFG